ncbi:MAG: class I SAM-dependent rRNA methyltransferase [Halothiobacillaceae bacterium]|nr:MAG: class I SAM-dependent rRNA methyltransferase [Halothiobacillaceae bacterium]
MSSSPTLAVLRLKKNEDRRLRAGHPWIYSNEVDTQVTPLTGFAPGQQVVVESHGGKGMGLAYVNPHSLIAARLFNREEHPLDRPLIVHRLKIALGLRERLFPTPHYRLIHGEADGLPGLVVDRYGDIIVAQVTTAGMEAVRDELVDALVRTLKPLGVLLRNDTSSRDMEGLPRDVELAYGEVPEQVELIENGARFMVRPWDGQKTGWFYDQADNRARLPRYVKGARVLDLFSYMGGWGVQALRHGASESVCVDSSSLALHQCRANADLNGVGEGLRTLEGDVFEVLKGLREERERFDVVVCDPPAFMKRRKDVQAGLEAYRRVNQMAMQVLARDGILISCSCSHHLQRDKLPELMWAAARHVDRNMQILEFGRQGVDHPIHPAIPETDYLKAVYARLLPA